MLFCKKGITILSSKKKIEFLKPLKTADVDNLKFTLLVKSQEDKDKENISTLVKEFSSEDGKKLGVFIKEMDRKVESAFSKSVSNAFKVNASELVDSSLIFSRMFGVKESKEIQFIKKACDATCILFSKHLKEKIMDVIDEDRVCLFAVYVQFSNCRKLVIKVFQRAVKMLLKIGICLRISNRNILKSVTILSFKVVATTT